MTNYAQRHAIQALQPDLNSTRDPGLNGKILSNVL